MKLLELTKGEQQTLREMGILHEHYRTRMRDQAILRLSQGLTLQQTADEFMVHINSIEQWRKRWSRLGLAGLYEGRHTGRPTKWSPSQREKLGELAQAEGGSARSLLRQIPVEQGVPAISASTAKRYPHQLNMRYKRARYSFKKTKRRGLPACTGSDRWNERPGQSGQTRVAVFR